MSESKLSWDNFYLGLAQYVSTKSKDPSTKVGCVIVDKNNRPISFGYNGLPQKIRDTEERLNNRELKYLMVIHAEINSIIFSKQSLSGCTIYTWPFQPCSNCASVLIQAGITRVVSLQSTNSRWLRSFELALELFEEAGVEVCLYPNYERIN